MSIFRVTYAFNKPISCSWVLGKVVETAYSFDYVESNLISAFIVADDEVEAMEAAERIAMIFIEEQRLLDGSLSHNLLAESYL